MAKKSLSVGVKVALIAAAAAIIVAIIPLLHNTTPTNSQTANNSPGSIQAGGDVIIPTLQNNFNNNSGGVMYVNQSSEKPNYIEGTDITKEEIEHEFPFGCVIFYFGQNKIQRYEIITNGLMDWKANMDEVQIEPNFNAGIVTWKIPNLTAVAAGGHGLHLEVRRVTMTCPLKRKAVVRCPMLYAGNNPVLYAATLNTNQRTPVFALGFRIPSPDEKQDDRK